MKSNRHGSPTGKAEKLIWGRSAGRCQNLNCNIDLTRHLTSGSRAANIGYMAHLIGSSENGPRGDEFASMEYAKNPENVMLLCDGCHREIDKEHPEKYSVETLREMKREHEEWVSRAVGLSPQNQSHVLRFTNRIEKNETSIPYDECIIAMQAIGKTPAESHPIDIKIGVSPHNEIGEEFWLSEPSDLELWFSKKMEGRLNDKDIRHLSVFGFAPMPLLIKLGQLLPDIQNIEVFTRHREPQPSWIWKNEGHGFEPYFTEGALDGTNRVALKLAITDKIEDGRIYQAVGDENISIWEITCEAPAYDIVSTREELSKFRTTVRKCFNRIKQVHGKNCEVLVFPAAPVACCIEFGRVWQPKTHPPFDVFDQVKDRGFVKRLRIE